MVFKAEFLVGLALRNQYTRNFTGSTFSPSPYPEPDASTSHLPNPHLCVILYYFPTPTCPTCFFPGQFRTALHSVMPAFLGGRNSPKRVMASSFTRFLDHTQRRTTVGRTPLDEWSPRRKDLYLTTHNTPQQTNFHASCGIRTHDLRGRAAADLRLRPRGHWDRRHACLHPSYLILFQWLQFSHAEAQ